MGICADEEYRLNASASGLVYVAVWQLFLGESTSRLFIRLSAHIVSSRVYLSASHGTFIQSNDRLWPAHFGSVVGRRRGVVVCRYPVVQGPAGGVDHVGWCGGSGVVWRGRGERGYEGVRKSRQV